MPRPAGRSAACWWAPQAAGRRPCVCGPLAICSLPRPGLGTEMEALEQGGWIRGANGRLTLGTLPRRPLGVTPGHSHCRSEGPRSLSVLLSGPLSASDPLPRGHGVVASPGRWGHPGWGSVPRGPVGQDPPCAHPFKGLPARVGPARVPEVGRGGWSWGCRGTPGPCVPPLALVGRIK